MRERFSSVGEQAFQSSHNELFDFLKSWGAVTLAFAVFIQPGHNVFQFNFIWSLLIAALTCGIGFVLHELGHRVVARAYGAEAHFAASPDTMLFLPILLAFVGFFVAAPGAVWHRGALSKAQLGHVAIAGPLTNLAIAFVFFLLLFIAPGSWFFFLYIGYQINAWLGLFNMIPVDPFDGAKILRWNKVAFGVTVVVAVLTVFVLPRAIGL